MCFILSTDKINNKKGEGNVQYITLGYNWVISVFVTICCITFTALNPNPNPVTITVYKTKKTKGHEENVVKLAADQEHAKTLAVTDDMRDTTQ